MTTKDDGISNIIDMQIEKIRIELRELGIKPGTFANYKVNNKDSNKDSKKGSKPESYTPLLFSQIFKTL